MKKDINITAIAITAIVVVAFLITVLYLFPGRAGKTVDANGYAEMSVPPDKAVVYLMIETKADSADKARDENAVISANIKNALAAIGVKESDIETENFNLRENCEWLREGKTCSGFVVTNNIKVSTKNFDEVGKIADAAIDNGALINYINYELSAEKSNEYKAAVLAEAAKDAKTKAEAIVAGLGKKLGSLVSITTSDYGYGPYRVFMAEAAVAVGEQKVPTELPARNLDITASVSAKYKIKG